MYAFETEGGTHGVELGDVIVDGEHRRIAEPLRAAGLELVVPDDLALARDRLLERLAVG